MKLRDLQNALGALPEEAPVAFRVDGDAISGGYHVTELKSARIESIDCGGRVASWQEATLQLLDGSGGEHMPVGTLAGILGRSLKALPRLADAPLQVEFSLNNRGLRIYQPELPVGTGDEVVIELRDIKAQCKPLTTTPRGCCEPKSACCA